MWSDLCDLLLRTYLIDKFKAFYFCCFDAKKAAACDKNSLSMFSSATSLCRLVQVQPAHQGQRPKIRGYCSRIQPRPIFLVGYKFTSNFSDRPIRIDHKPSGLLPILRGIPFQVVILLSIPFPAKPNPLNQVSTTRGEPHKAFCLCVVLWKFS